MPLWCILAFVLTSVISCVRWSFSHAPSSLSSVYIWVIECRQSSQSTALWLGSGCVSWCLSLPLCYGHRWLMFIQQHHKGLLLSMCVEADNFVVLLSSWRSKHFLTVTRWETVFQSLFVDKNVHGDLLYNSNVLRHNDTFWALKRNCVNTTKRASLWCSSCFQRLVMLKKDSF